MPVNHVVLLCIPHSQDMYLGRLLGPDLSISLDRDLIVGLEDRNGVVGNLGTLMVLVEAMCV